jgi:DNA-binding response OmpR family regulator
VEYASFNPLAGDCANCTRVLIIEGDPPLSKFLQQGLEAEHYTADAAASSEQAQHLAKGKGYDLVILDLNLPGGDGLDLLRSIRNANAALPMLVLSTQLEVRDRVMALDMGADDCLPKPFALAELLARARALLRRARRPNDEVLRVEDLELNRVERQVSRSGKLIELTPKELSLLECLMLNAGRCVTRTMIIENVWKTHSEIMTNVIDVYVNYLRKKIDGGFERKLIRTVRGAGYQIGEGTE